MVTVRAALGTVNSGGDSIALGIIHSDGDSVAFE